MRLLTAIALLLALVLPAAGAQMSDETSRPNPDPTTLTTAALKTAMDGLRELAEQRFRAIEAEIALNKTTVDKTDDRLVLRLDNIPTRIDAAFAQLQRLTDERFKAVDQQFAGRDTALSAALLAQKASVDDQNRANAAASQKAETATTKQIESIQTLLASQAKAIDDKISVLSGNIAEVRALLTGSVGSATGRQSGQSDLWGYLIGGLGIVVAIATFAMRMRPRD